MVSAEWKEGMIAYENGLGPHANPYPAGTVEHADWLAGWNAEREPDERTQGEDPHWEDV